MKKSYFLILIFGLLSTINGLAQQDPQYTQYMYNTQVVNPAYAGSRNALSFGALYRTQWVGFEGAPKTGTFTINSPIGALKNMGLGLSIVRDELGPAIESNVNIDYSYTINTSEKGELSFGLKAGVDLLNVDFTKLNIFDNQELSFQNNIDNKLLPQAGAGIFYNTDRFYVGLSVPNFFTTEHYDQSSATNGQNISAERLHYFLIAGHVFTLSENLKFKPATLVKAVSGSPLQWDVTANFLINEKFILGAAYRWSAAVSALAGFQASQGLFIGLGYDYQTTDIERVSDGSYEIILRFEIFNNLEKFITPRFF